MLGEAARAAGYRLIVHDAVSSTMEEAREARARGDPGRLWIVARSQSAGRGRHGRQWSSPPGNLYASLLLVEPCEIALAPQLGFVAGLALHDAVAAVTGLAAPRLALKWPNDLLLDQAKLAGLLLEGQSLSGQFAVTIGIGVNIASGPDGAPYRVASLRSQAPAVTVEEVLGALSDAWVRRFESWLLPGGFGPTRAAWLERAAFLGQMITLRLVAGAVSGRFIGLDAYGRIEIECDGERRVIDAGDLYFNPPSDG